MRKSKIREEARKRERWFYILFVSRIVAEITMIIGFFIIIYLLILQY